MKLYYDIKKREFIEDRETTKEKILKGEVISTTTEKEAINLLNEIVKRNNINTL